MNINSFELDELMIPAIYTASILSSFIYATTHYVIFKAFSLALFLKSTNYRILLPYIIGDVIISENVDLCLVPFLVGHWSFIQANKIDFDLIYPYTVPIFVSSLIIVKALGLWDKYDFCRKVLYIIYTTS